MTRSVWLTLLLAGCPEVPVLDASVVDAPITDAVTDAADDAGSDAGALGMPLGIAGPAYPFVGTEACYRATPMLPPDAVLSVVWGDGERETAAPGTSELCHTYRFPGPLVIGMTVTRGARDESATLLVHVVFAPRALPVTRSSSVAVDAAGRVWVVEPDADVVSVFDAEGALVRREAVGDRPRSVAIAGDRALVACQGDGTLHVLGPSSSEHQVISLGPTGSGPFGVVMDPRGEHALVSLLRAGEVVAVTLASATVISRVAVGRDPRALAMRDDGLLVVSHWRATEAGTTVALIDASDPSALSLASEVFLPREVGRDADTDNDGVLSFVDALALSPDGGRAIVGGLKANVVAGLARTGLPLTAQTTARGALAEVLLGAIDAPGEDSLRRPLDDLDAIGALSFSPMGEIVYYAVPGAEVVIAADAFSFDTAGSIDEVGHGVDGLALDAAGETLYVHAALSRELRAYDVRDLSTDPAARFIARTVDTEPFNAEVLEGAIIFSRSRDPRMSRTRYLSCASCHRDGESDGLTWDFTQRGEGLRNTIDLVGHGVGHGPIHWSANFDEVQDFEHDIRGGQGGTGFLSDAVFRTGTRDTPLGDPKAGLSPELDALAAYLTSLDSFGVSPTRREADPAWEAARARGEAIFRDPLRRCTECHTGALTTDSAFITPGVPVLHDVGTLAASSGDRLGAPLTGLDTPTLRGLWATAPYLHDGSAPTLEEVLTTRNLADRHGVTQDLSSSERADLITFLLSLDDRAP